MRGKSNKITAGIFTASSIILGVYASDFHKFICKAYLFTNGNIQASIEYGRLSDIALASLCCFCTFLVLITSPKLDRFLNIPVLIHCSLVSVFILAYIFLDNDEANETYTKLVAGNFLLFVSSIAVCRTLKKIEITLWIWVIASMGMAIVSLAMHYHGINWSSARTVVFPNIGIRMGYFCAISSLFTISKFQGKISFSDGLILAITTVLIGGVLTSGSNGALLVLGIGLSGYFLLCTALSLKFSRIKLLLLAPLFIATPIALNSAQPTANIFMEQTGSVEAITYSYEGRITIFEDYIQRGMRNPFTGNGVLAAYESYYARTHSVLLSLFVQVGLPGLSIYICFIISIIMRITKAFQKRSEISDGLLSLSIVLLMSTIGLIVKGEITSDLPGNREIWFFAGLFVSVSHLWSPLVDGPTQEPTA